MRVPGRVHNRVDHEFVVVVEENGCECDWKKVEEQRPWKAC